MSADIPECFCFPGSRCEYHKALDIIEQLRAASTKIIEGWQAGNADGDDMFDEGMNELEAAIGGTDQRSEQ